MSDLRVVDAIEEAKSAVANAMKLPATTAGGG
jgi:hypothetical protein